MYKQRTMIPLAERFWTKVDKQGPDECWEWTGATSYGYGCIGIGRVGQKRVLKAHRVSWEMHNGAIPDGALVLHHCDNPPCVNPAHLFLGDHVANSDDKVAKGRQQRGEGHHNRKLNMETVREMRRRYAAGEGTTGDLGAEYGVWQATVSSIVRGRLWANVAETDGLQPVINRMLIRSHEAHGKLDEVAVIEIRRRYAAGEAQSVLAAEFGVSAPAISSVVRRKTWKHVD